MYFDFSLTPISSAEDKIKFCESDSVVECLAWYSGFPSSSLPRSTRMTLYPLLSTSLTDGPCCFLAWHFILCLVPAWQMAHASMRMTLYPLLRTSLTDGPCILAWHYVLCLVQAWPDAQFCHWSWRYILSLV